MFAYGDPEAIAGLMDKLLDVSAAYLVRQLQRSTLPRLRYFLLSKPIGRELLTDALLLRALVDD
jgi:hypothetical protein